MQCSLLSDEFTGIQDISHMHVRHAGDTNAGQGSCSHMRMHMVANKW